METRTKMPLSAYILGIPLLYGFVAQSLTSLGIIALPWTAVWSPVLLEFGVAAIILGIWNMFFGDDGFGLIMLFCGPVTIIGLVIAGLA